VQWHPEVGDDPKLFEALAEAALEAAQERSQAEGVASA
jgi:hypothetical protein